MRLIDADLLKLNDFEILLGGSYKGLLQILLEKIENAPPVDAVEVVRCKDCKWRNGLRCYHKRSSMDDLVGENDFCAWGERRENE